MSARHKSDEIDSAQLGLFASVPGEAAEPVLEIPLPRTAFVPDLKQKQAIEHVEGPMLVVAGAGTGKTTVLVQRMVRLLEAGNARANEILAVSYTRNSAAELKDRVRREMDARFGAARATEADSLQTSTFHAYCGDVLSRAGQTFTPLTGQDLYVLLRQNLESLRLRHYVKAARPGQFLNSLLAFFERCDDELVCAGDYRQYLNDLKAGKHPPPRVLKAKDAELLGNQEVIDRCEEIAGVFERVTTMLEARNLGTYGNMISRTVKLLENDPALLAQERARARFILIDEFQDTNVAQIRLAGLLAGEAENIFAVGDPDQAIYRFRGATTGAFDHFQRQFHQVKHVVLDRNRRSTSAILRCAYQVINENPPIMQGGQITRQLLVSAREEKARSEGQPSKALPVEVVITPRQFSNDVEAAEVAEAIDRIQKSCPGCKWRDFAVLYRQHDHRNGLIRELNRRHIPFLVRGVNVLDTPEVRDALAAMRAIANMGDNVALFRLSALPQFGIDAQELRSALRAAGRDATMFTVLPNVKGGPELMDVLSKCRRLTEEAGHLARAALEKALLVLRIPSTPATRALHEFIIEWSKKPLTDNGTLLEFLEYLDYFVEGRGCINLPEPDENDTANAVQLMSAHSAKGLEFSHVFVLRAISGSFPTSYREDLFEFPHALHHSLTLFEEDAKTIHEQEERRLFYVALTRARDTLAIYAKQGTGVKDPTPPGFVRGLLKIRTLSEVLTTRTAQFRPEIAAAAAVTQAFSAVGDWMLMPASNALENLSLSATRIEMYSECPLRFKIETEWNIPSEPAAAMQFGNAVHTTLKGFYDAVQAGRSPSRHLFLESFVEEFSKMHMEDSHQKQLYLAQGLKQLGEFYDLRNSEASPEVLATEKRFSLVVGGVKIVGRIDRADRLPNGSIAIVDYKTGIAKTEEDADKSLQLSIYAMAAQQEWDCLPEKLEFYNVSVNAAAETVRTPENLNAARLTIETAAASIRDGKFAPKAGFHCSFCGYRELCPAQESPLYGAAEALPANAKN